jgi:hypothetical protein
MYTVCTYGMFGREITKYTVTYRVLKQFWPTLVRKYIWGRPSFTVTEDAGSAHMHGHITHTDANVLVSTYSKHTTWYQHTQSTHLLHACRQRRQGLRHRLAEEPRRGRQGQAQLMQQV